MHTLVVCQQVEFGQEADDLGKASEWRCGRRIVEEGILKYIYFA